MIPLKGYNFDAQDMRDLWEGVQAKGPKLLKEVATRDRGLYSNVLANYPMVCVFLRDWDSSQNSRGTYNDPCIVYEKGKCIKVYHANTNPQPFWRARVAEIKAPQALLHTPGMHGVSGTFPHMAWRQYSTVKLSRDPAIQGGPRIDDLDSLNAKFWINLHSGGWTSTNSLGCLTIAKGEWADFYKLTIDKTKAHKQAALLSFVFEVE